MIGRKTDSEISGLGQLTSSGRDEANRSWEAWKDGARLAKRRSIRTEKGKKEKARSNSEMKEGVKKAFRGKRAK